MEEINIKNIVQEKSPETAKKIPNFVFSLLNKLLCMKQINAFLREHGDEQGIQFVDSVLFDLSQTKINVIGLENIPENDRIILASNHPLGGLDGLAFIHVVHKKRQNITFPVNDFLTFIPNFDEFFIPVNKVGSNSRDASKVIQQAFESDNTILMFPAGLCSRKIKGKIVDLEWKKTFVRQAVTTQRDIVPVFINDRNSNFFYNVANLRKFLKIKFNIEMSLLPREMFKQKGKTIELIIGKPIPWQTFDKSKSEKEWAQMIKEDVYKLKNERING
ncbi:1-acyl-sn-glycerol-3-phosphate acyltransferase [Odoribacter sp. OttesenSCG-928-L07]|nr:1-acyl-sn-glycerol-3-phosphate acyltransferase [Odoribacter sp. OttesenSCG-928-L07]MDL2239200.1 1-acyl-sn-glycerol-3-phosphate acyltransferase [Bacteroidales bacterium OttesenSCG-928-L14]MDL2240544.1 1-acyl-sn-glycerol-3-phosphate acyltransferase [Bacteroidales bacterium OttesenSCG-928-K22]